MKLISYLTENTLSILNKASDDMCFTGILGNKAHQILLGITSPANRTEHKEHTCQALLYIFETTLTTTD